MRTTALKSAGVVRFGNVGACLQAIRIGARQRSFACKQAPTGADPAKRTPVESGATGPTTAFTLVELMAVIGLIVVLAAGFTTVLHRGGNAGVALRAARRELESVLRLAQATARARQVPVRLCLLSAPAREAGTAGRRWWLVRAEGTGWVRLREAGELPAGTCAVTADRSALRIRTGLVWPDSLLSQLDGPVADEAGAMFFVEFRPDGSVSGGPRRIVVAAADEAPGQAPRLVDPAAVQIISMDGSGRIEQGDTP